MAFRFSWLFAFSFLVGGCAPQQPTHSPLLTPAWKSPGGQSCRVSGWPVQLPDLVQVLDTVGLTAQFPPSLRSGGFATLELRYDSLGMADTVRLVESTLPPVAEQGLIAMAQTRLSVRSPFPLKEDKERNNWSGLIRISGGPAATYQIGWSEVCNPVLLNRTAVVQKLEREFSAVLKKLPYIADQQLKMRIQVDTTGTVLLAYPSVGTQYPEVTRAVQRVAVAMRFLPAWRNRRRVTSWVSIPVNLKNPPPAPIPPLPGN